MSVVTDNELDRLRSRIEVLEHHLRKAPRPTAALDQLRREPHDPVETLLPKSVTEDLLADPDIWTAPTLENSWANLVGVAGYYRDPYGIVHLRGFLGGTTINTVAFTLPAGYRPTQQWWFNPARGSGTGGALVAVNTDGTVVPVVSAGTPAQGFSLAGISFRVT